MKLSSNDYKFLQSLCMLQDINESEEYNKNALMSSITVNEEITIDIENAGLLLDFIDDKKLEYGFNKDYSVNSLGQKATLLWDKIFNELND